MSDRANGTDGDVSRRRLLRVAGISVGAGLFGVAGSVDQVAASYCPRSPEYWAEHEWPETDRIDDSFVLVDPADERSLAVWRLFLDSDAREDRGAVMARHLLAAHLNFQWRQTDDPNCVDQPLSAYDGRTVRELRAAAKQWLAASNWPDEQPEWIVDGVDGEPLKDALGAFNHGQLDELDCNCAYLDRDDDWSPTAGTNRSDVDAESPISEGTTPEGNRTDGFEGAQRTEDSDGDEKAGTGGNPSDDESCSGPRSSGQGPCLFPRLWR